MVFGDCGDGESCRVGSDCCHSSRRGRELFIHNVDRNYRDDRCFRDK